MSHISLTYLWQPPMSLGSDVGKLHGEILFLDLIPCQHHIWRCSYSCWNAISWIQTVHFFQKNAWSHYFAKTLEKKMPEFRLPTGASVTSTVQTIFGARGAMKKNRERERTIGSQGRFWCSTGLSTGLHNQLLFRKSSFWRAWQAAHAKPAAPEPPTSPKLPEQEKIQEKMEPDKERALSLTSALVQEQECCHFRFRTGADRYYSLPKFCEQ